MYSFLKKNIKLVLPKQFLFKNELLFRHFHGIFYLGNKHQCNICSKKLRSFILLENNDLLCPFCGSLSRNRRLWSLLNTKNYLNGNVLHFSPSRSLYRKLKHLNAINYFASDFQEEFLAEYHFNITSIDQPDEKFDLIICYHVLEHVVDDGKAMQELYRVLKPRGSIFIQTPFKEGKIYEDPSIVLPQERKTHFGQEDHVRIYSVNGLKNRFKEKGFNIEIKAFESSNHDVFHGFKSPESVLILTK